MNICTAFGLKNHHWLRILIYELESCCENGSEAGTVSQYCQAGVAGGRGWC